MICRKSGVTMPRSMQVTWWEESSSATSSRNEAVKAQALYAFPLRRNFPCGAGIPVNLVTHHHHPFALAHLSRVGWIGKPPLRVQYLSALLVREAMGIGPPPSQGQAGVGTKMGSRRSAMRLPS